MISRRIFLTQSLAATGVLTVAPEQKSFPSSPAGIEFSLAVRNSGFNGYIGIEYEGFTQPEEDGIRNTKALLERYL